MKITEIYSRYNVPENLQLHMFYVSAVAKSIIDNCKVEINRANILKTCLLHDIGNLVKFNFTVKPELFQPEGIDYWQKVQNKLIKKYGSDEKEASIQIAKELNQNKRVIELIECIEFVNLPSISDSSDLEKQICIYSDQRVDIDGVKPVEARIQQSFQRFIKNKNIPKEEIAEFKKTNERNILIAKKLEETIFSKCTITPREITKRSVENYIAKLRDYKIN